MRKGEGRDKAASLPPVSEDTDDFCKTLTKSKIELTPSDQFSSFVHREGEGGGVCWAPRSNAAAAAWGRRAEDFDGRFVR